MMVQVLRLWAVGWEAFLSGYPPRLHSLALPQVVAGTIPLTPPPPPANVFREGCRVS